MAFVNELRKETSKTLTENGAVTYNTSLNATLDLFAMGGALRSRSEKEIELLFDKAFAENPETALKCLFYLRDIRGGQGERRTFKVIVKYLANNAPDKLMPLLHLFPEYGRYDDLLTLIDTPLQKNALDILFNIAKGADGFKPDALLFKWLPSENASSKETKRLAKIVREHFGLSQKEYRKALTYGREKVKGLVERPMSANKWSEIVYEQVPSKANLKYRTAFHKRDGERYAAFIESVAKGEKKINSSTLYPADIANKILNRGEKGKELDALWNALPNYVQKDQNALVVADTSGSMYDMPIAVSTSLALYFAERNKGPFKDHFITFSSNPTMQKIQGTGIVQKLQNLNRAHWEMNTDLVKVFELVLNTAIQNRVGQDEMPKTIYIISDMEFDSCCDTNTNFQVIEAAYKEAGYEMPHLVFWNVASRQDNLPVTENQKGVSLVSGYSPVLFRQVMEGKTPVELMLEVLNQERYEPIYCKI